MAEWDQVTAEMSLRQQESLRAVIESISSELELRPLLTSIVYHACALLSADRGTIGLVDETRNLVRTEAAYGMPPDELGAEMPSGVGLAGRVLETRAPALLHHYGELEQPTQMKMLDDAVLGLPIFWRDRIIGVFGIGAVPPRRFNDEDIATLTLFARHAAIAIENARLFDAEKRRVACISTINQIARLIAQHLEFADLLHEALRLIGEDLQFPSLRLLLSDEQLGERLVCQAAIGPTTIPLSVGDQHPSNDGLIGAAAHLRQVVCINNPPGLSYLALPVRSGRQVVGVLYIESPRPLRPDDAINLEVVADQLGVAIENARLFSQLQQSLAETRLLYETSHDIGAASAVNEVVAAYLKQVAMRGRYACTIVLYEFDAAGAFVARLVRGRWAPEEGLSQLQVRHDYERDALDDPLDAGETVTIADVRSDPRVPPGLRRMQEESQRPAMALIPLMVRGQRIGLVVLTYSRPHPWSQSDLHPYQATAAQLATVIDSRRQQRLLYARGEQIAILEERQRLARDLHDSVTQLIFSINLISQTITSAWQRDPAEGERRVNRTVELSQLALGEMRALLASLRPAEEGSRYPVVRSGLAQALQQYAAQVFGGDLEVAFEADGYLPQSADREEVLYRIGQEALNNISKHAGARRVAVTLLAEADALILRVRDDGVGLPPPAAQRSPAGRGPGVPSGTPPVAGLGLHTMRERAEACGGTLAVTSAPGRGTLIEAIVPRR